MEKAVWRDCREFVLHPEEALADAQRQLRERLDQSATVEAERQRLKAAPADKEQERERVMTLYRRGRVTLDEAEAQLDATGREASEIRGFLEAVRAQRDLASAFEARYVEAAALLTRLRDRLEDIEREGDWTAKRRLVELLVARIDVTTVGTGRKRSARVAITYTFGPARDVAPV
ncbi:MAG TPA: hypothetical protein VHL09_05940 [Dehalococcoidia bacterium]|nr:hypothetical protein [Dehalococcoidia bacterium]